MKILTGLSTLARPQEQKRKRSANRHRSIRGLGAAAPAIALGLVFTPAASALAQEDLATGDPDTVIDTTPAERADRQIAERLQSIYAQIESLEGVEVAVREGVVILSGTVPNDAQAQRAVDLATRLEGVVTVDDRVERTLDIEGNVLPLIDQFESDLSRWLRALPLILLALAVLAAIVFLGHLLAKWESLWRKLMPNPFLAELAAQAVRVVFVILGFVVALNLIGATTLMGTLLGGAGLLGIAIGFAVRDTMENYVSSIMLSVRQPFRAKDHVVIGDQEGRVIRLSSRATILMTLDGNHLRIPNSTVFKAVILNYTRNPERRFDFVLGIDAEDDPVAAMSTGVEQLTTLDFVLDKPAPGALIQEVGDSSIGIKFMAWVDQTETDFGKARSLAIREVKQILEEQGFTLPEPIYRLRFDQPIAGTATVTSEEPAAPAQDDRTDKPQRPTAATAGEADDAVLDVRPDVELERMVDEELASSEASEDLLDDNRPVE